MKSIVAVIPSLGNATRVTGSVLGLEKRMKIFPNRIVVFVSLLVSLAGVVDATELSLLSQGIELMDISGTVQRSIEVPNDLKDLSAYQKAKITLENRGDHYCRVEAWFGPEWMRMTSSAHLEPGESRDLTIHLKRHQSYLEDVDTLFPGMRAIPGGTLLHWADVDYVNDSKTFLVRVFAEETTSVAITGVVAFDEYRKPKDVAAEDGFFPFIDVYGQYKHADWPGKVHSGADLIQAISDEEADIAAHPAPDNRNQYGGWVTGPKLDATGRFRVEKYEGKWWFVDPEGALFWSFGTTGIRDGAAETKTQDREHFYEDLPLQSDAIYGGFVNPYNNQFSGRTYVFGNSNLLRKYGDDWFSKNRDNTLKRLKSWGLNTMANWSTSNFYRHTENRTPYTVAIHFTSDRIHSSVDVPDPFASDFRTKVNNAVRNNLGDSKDDAYCLGFFIDNEIHFKENNVKHYVANGYMKQATNSPGKQALIDFLKGKYATISDLNQAWNRSYANWDAVSSLNEFPNTTGADADAVAWESEFADKLYQVYNEEAKAVAPDTLYLGSRFLHDTPMHIVNAAAPHLDVVSVNWYQASPDSILVPSVDKPIVIGEFHFGAVERGFFHTGLRGVGTQADRAEAYRYYYRDALNHPNVVGAHWFQYLSQSPTGRKDGESYQIGMVDVCDTPYPELRDAARAVGKTLYAERSGVSGPLDTDGDGIPDLVEEEHGLDSTDKSDSGLDKDGDGKSNVAEYILGTDISTFDASFNPQIKVHDGIANIVVPKLYVQTGRTYSLEYTSDLSVGSQWESLTEFVVSDEQDKDLKFDHELNDAISYFKVRVALYE